MKRKKRVGARCRECQTACNTYKSEGADQQVLAKSSQPYSIVRLIKGDLIRRCVQVGSFSLEYDFSGNDFTMDELPIAL